MIGTPVHYSHVVYVSGQRWKWEVRHTSGSWTTTVEHGTTTLGREVAEERARKAMLAWIKDRHGITHD